MNRVFFSKIYAYFSDNVADKDSSNNMMKDDRHILALLLLFGVDNKVFMDKDYVRLPYYLDKIVSVLRQNRSNAEYRYMISDELVAYIKDNDGDGFYHNFMDIISDIDVRGYKTYNVSLIELIRRNKAYDVYKAYIKLISDIFTFLGADNKDIAYDKDIVVYGGIDKITGIRIRISLEDKMKYLLDTIVYAGS